MPKLSKFGTTLTKLVSKAVVVRPPLWDGPCSSSPMGGITISLLSKFLCCQERFRLRVIEGWKPHDSFSHRMEYGNLLHAGFEATSANKPWLPAITDYAKSLVSRYRERGQEIDKWFQVAKVQYKIYLKYWEQHSDVKSRKPVYQEKVFSVEYKLPSGKTVFLRGKFDAVDFINDGLYVDENKSKSEILVDEIQRNLPWDLQVMTYLTALVETRVLNQSHKPIPVKGVRYNVIKRPLSGRGKGNIKQKKGRGKAKTGAETSEEFYERLGKEIEKYPKEFFQRFKMDVSPEELKRFQDCCLNPILENLVDNYEWWVHCHLKCDGHVSVFDYLERARRFSHHQNRHFIFPSNVWNPVLEGRQGDYDEFIQTGSTKGLERVDKLFGELN